jgi:hypothetical protein
MRRVTSVGFLITALLVACAHVKPSPPPATPSPAPVVVTHASEWVAKPAAPPGEPPHPGASPTSPMPAPSAATGAAPRTEETPAQATPPAASTAATPSPAKAAGTTMGKPAHGDTAAKAATPGERTPPPASQAAVASPAQKPAASMALDLNSLEQRLRDTRAIGLFTKLSLKNQVDDLLAEFRGFHGGRIPPTLADLRQRYDLLLLKVLTLLQDGDPPLATAVSASRDAIWGILADREKFQKI